MHIEEAGWYLYCRDVGVVRKKSELKQGNVVETRVCCWWGGKEGVCGCWRGGGAAVVGRLGYEKWCWGEWA